MAKIIKHSNEFAPLANKLSWAETLSSGEAYMTFPENKDWRKRFILSLYNWAEEEEALELQQFYWKMKLSRQLIYLWRDAYPDIKTALDEVKLMLGSKKRIGAIKKIYDREAVYKDMHVYDPEYLAINKYHAELKNIEGQQGNVYIEMQSAPVTGKVKARIKSDETQGNDV